MNRTYYAMFYAIKAVLLSQKKVSDPVKKRGEGDVKEGRSHRNFEKKRPYLRDNFEVEKIGLFGSFARGENKKDNDIDIVIEFRGEKSLFDLASLKIELEDVLEMKVDVLTYNSLHPLIRGKILKEHRAKTFAM